MAMTDGWGLQTNISGYSLVGSRGGGEGGVYSPEQCPTVRFGMYDVADMEMSCLDTPLKKGLPVQMGGMWLAETPQTLPQLSSGGHTLLQTSPSQGVSKAGVQSLGHFHPIRELWRGSPGSEALPLIRRRHCLCQLHHLAAPAAQPCFPPFSFTNVAPQ